MSRHWFRRTVTTERSRRKAPARVRSVMLIGYWRSDREPVWPDPFDFVDDDWDPEERELVATYLDTATHTPWAYCGYSHCRICVAGREHVPLEAREETEIVVNGRTFTGYKPLPGEMNGSGERSDGTYVWPEGLSHYVREHSVRLPLAIVEHIRSCGTPAAVNSATLSTSYVDEAPWRCARPDWRRK